MRLSDGIELLEGMPVLYLRGISAIVCSDLHLGYEGVMADRGTFLPKANLKSIKKTLKLSFEMTGAERIIIDGDIKNEFSDVHAEEFNETKELVEYLNALGIKHITLIKGNHDNFIDRLGLPLGIEIYRQEARIEEMLFFHGEEVPEGNANLLIMGHLHPAITLYKSIGGKEKMRCFLSGKTKDGRHLVVLPAIGYFAESVSVNIENAAGIAPFFGEGADIDQMEAFCISEGETLRFGKVKHLRELAHRGL